MTECRRNSTVGHFQGQRGLIYQATLAQGPHNKPWKIRTALLNKILQTKRYFQPNHFPSLPPLPRVRSTPFMMASLTSPVFLPISLIGIALHISHKLLILNWSLLLSTLWSGKPKLEIWFCYHLFRMSKYFLKGLLFKNLEKHKLGKVVFEEARWNKKHIVKKKWRFSWDFASKVIHASNSGASPYKHL